MAVTECPACNAPVGPDDTFCGQCGAPLDGPVGAPAGRRVVWPIFLGGALVAALVMGYLFIVRPGQPFRTHSVTVLPTPAVPDAPPASGGDEDPAYEELDDKDTARPETTEIDLVFTIEPPPLPLPEERPLPDAPPAPPAEEKRPIVIERVKPEERTGPSNEKGIVPPKPAPALPEAHTPTPVRWQRFHVTTNYYLTEDWRSFNPYDRQAAFSIRVPTSWAFRGDSFFDVHGHRIARLTPGVVSLQTVQRCFSRMQPSAREVLLHERPFGFGRLEGAKRVTRMRVPASFDGAGDVRHLYCVDNGRVALVLSFFSEKASLNTPDAALFDRVMTSLRFD